MNNGQKTVATMLAVVAVMLGLNLIVRGSPTAVAQVASGPAEPVLVDAQYHENTGYFWRFFSDGTVDMLTVAFSGLCNPIDPAWCDPGDIGPHVVLPPLVPPGSPGPRVVGGRWQKPGNPVESLVFRFWSDGSVDSTPFSFPVTNNGCVPGASTCGNPGTFQVIGPPPYAACAPFDSNLNGTVDVPDLLALLAAWGCASGL